MPFSYEIDKERKLVLAKFSGFVSLDESRAFHAALLADPDFSPDMNRLSDARDAENTLSPEEMRRLTAESRLAPAQRTAIVARRDVVFGLSRIYQALADLRGDVHEPVGVFAKLH